MARQQKSIGVKTTAEVLSLLEKALFSGRRHYSHVPSSVQNLLSVSIVDESGKELKMEDLPSAYLALVYTGELGKIREIQAAFRINAEVKESELAEAAAHYGYLLTSQKYLQGLRVAKFLPMDALLSDFDLIEQITGVHPEEEVYYAVLEGIISVKDSPRYNGSEFPNMLKKYIMRMKRDSIAINHEAAQKVYNTVDLYTQELEKRIERLYELLGVYPAIGGRELTPNEYAALIKLQYPRYLDKEGYLHSQFFGTFAKNYRKTFLDETRRIMADAQQEGNLEKLAYRALRALEAAATENIELPEDILAAVPKVIPKGILSLLVGDRETISHLFSGTHSLFFALRTISKNETYAELCRDAFAAASREAFIYTVDNYLAVGPEEQGGRRSGLLKGKSRIGYINRVARIMGIDLNKDPEIAQYASKISGYYRQRMRLRLNSISD